MKYPYDFDKVVSYDRNSTFETMYSQLKNIDFTFKPNEVSLQEVSEFVENLILQVPVGQMILFEKPQKGTYIAVGGDSLLTKVKLFGDGKVKFTGLKILSKLNELSFGELDEDTQRSIENSVIHTLMYRGGNDKFLEVLKERVKE